MRLLVILLCGLLIFTSTFEQSSNATTCSDVIVYKTSNDDNIRYYQMDVRQGSETELPFENIASAPRWSPDGTYIAIASHNVNGGFDLSVVNLHN